MHQKIINKSELRWTGGGESGVCLVTRTRWNGNRLCPLIHQVLILWGGDRKISNDDQLDDKTFMWYIFSNLFLLHLDMKLALNFCQFVFFLHLPLFPSTASFSCPSAVSSILHTTPSITPHPPPDKAASSGGARASPSPSPTGRRREVREYHQPQDLQVKFQIHCHLSLVSVIVSVVVSVIVVMMSLWSTPPDNR